MLIDHKRTSPYIRLINNLKTHHRHQRTLSLYYPNKTWCLPNGEDENSSDKVTIAMNKIYQEPTKVKFYTEHLTYIYFILTIKSISWTEMQRKNWS